MTTNETKAVLYLMVQGLREVSEQAFYAHEMAWQIYGGLLKADPDFAQKYQSVSGLKVSELVRLRDGIAATLSRIEEQLQQLKD